MTAIWASSVRKGMWVDRGGERCQVTSVTCPGGNARANLRRENGTATRAPLIPGTMITLADDQGTCADCALPLVPGVDEEADQFRAIGYDSRARYFCGQSADALHHPVPARHS